MPNNSAFDDLSPAEITLIENEIKARNFKDYDGLVAFLQQQGLQLSRSALWRRGKSIKDRLQMLKDTTDTAMMIGESVKDEGGNLNDATLSLIQASLFNAVNDYIDDDNTDAEGKINTLSKAAKASSEIGRAAIMVKKYKQEVKTQLQVELDKLEAIDGMDKRTIKEVRATILDKILGQSDAKQ